MDIKVNGNTIDISSPIITLSDVEKVIGVLKTFEDKPELVINVKSFAFPSGIIGELLRLHDTGVKITLNLYDKILYELFDALSLTDKFKIKVA